MEDYIHSLCVFISNASWWEIGECAKKLNATQGRESWVSFLRCFIFIFQHLCCHNMLSARSQIFMNHLEAREVMGRAMCSRRRIKAHYIVIISISLSAVQSKIKWVQKWFSFSWPTSNCFFWPLSGGLMTRTTCRKLPDWQIDILCEWKHSPTHTHTPTPIVGLPRSVSCQMVFESVAYK